MLVYDQIPISLNVLQLLDIKSKQIQHSTILKVNMLAFTWKHYLLL